MAQQIPEILVEYQNYTAINDAFKEPKMIKIFKFHQLEIVSMCVCSLTSGPRLGG